MTKHRPLTVEELDLPLKRATPIGPRKPPKPPEATRHPSTTHTPDPASSIPQTAPAGGFGGDSPSVWTPRTLPGSSKTTPARAWDGGRSPTRTG